MKDPEGYHVQELEALVDINSTGSSSGPRSLGKTLQPTPQRKLNLLLVIMATGLATSCEFLWSARKKSPVLTTYKPPSLNHIHAPIPTHKTNNHTGAKPTTTPNPTPSPTTPPTPSPTSPPTPGPTNAPTPPTTAPPTSLPTSPPTSSPTPQPTAPPTNPPTGPPIDHDHDTIVARQIENFKKEDGLMLNFHITHHGGTTFCGQIGKRLRAPSFACMGPEPPQVVGDDFAQTKQEPWSHKDTSKNIAITKQYFDMVSWEFARAVEKQGPQLADTDWESPNLVSVYITREPISRLLAGNGDIKRRFPKIHTHSPDATLEDWMAFAHDDRHTNNYALRVLAGWKCCNGNNTDPIHLEHAKDLVRRFTYVLDIGCLDAGMQAVADQLGMNITLPQTNKRHQHPPTSERIPFPEVYDFLLERNKLDIELYEWTKSISLVDCDAEEG